MRPGPTRMKLAPLLAWALFAWGCAANHAPARQPVTPIAAQATAAPIRFVDVTRAAGLHFQHVNGASGRYYYPELFGSGCVFFDYDGDGWLDIFLVNSGPLPGFKPPAARPTCALYHNNRDGSFTDVTRQAGLAVPMYGMGACAGDYDNDGHADLYVTAALGPSHLFHNNGNGTFTDVAKQAGVDNDGHWGTSCAWLDYNNDGLPDLFVCNYVRYRLDNETVCHQGDLRVYCGPVAYTAESCRLFRNLGHGKFRDVTREAGIERTSGKSLGVTVWDFDGKGYPDLVVANDLTPNYLFRNKKDGTFEEIGVDSGVAYGSDGAARSGMGVDVADYRNDGRSAIFVSNFAREPNSFFTQWQEPYSFSDRTFETGMGEPSLTPLGFGLFFFDYDNDGWKDAFVTNGHIQPDIARFEPGQTFAQPPLLFHNRGDGTFEEVSKQVGDALQQPCVGRGAIYGDYDNDGDLDILVTTNNGPPHLFRNDGGNRHAWLKILLVGVKCNRDGLGAQVTVRAGGRTLRDQRHSGSSYLSSSTPWLHFGLGDAKQADSVEVRWPDGSLDRLASVPANQSLTLTEGSHPAR